MVLGLVGEPLRKIEQLASALQPLAYYFPEKHWRRPQRTPGRIRHQ